MGRNYKKLYEPKIGADGPTPAQVLRWDRRAQREAGMAERRAENAQTGILLKHAADLRHAAERAAKSNAHSIGAAFGGTFR